MAKLRVMAQLVRVVGRKGGKRLPSTFLVLDLLCRITLSCLLTVVAYVVRFFFRKDGDAGCELLVRPSVGRPTEYGRPVDVSEEAREEGVEANDAGSDDDGVRVTIASLVAAPPPGRSSIRSTRPSPLRLTDG